MRIILIPGLGYNCRIFENLDLSDFDKQCLNWIEPFPNEKLREYSQRIFNQIENNHEKLIIIGHSFGGIVAQEIASFERIDQIILISSIKSRKEMPWHFKIVKSLFLHKFFTKQMSIKTVNFWGKTHGFETQNEKELFKDMVGHHTNTYLQWALKSLSSWQETKIPNSTTIFHVNFLIAFANGVIYLRKRFHITMMANFPCYQNFHHLLLESFPSAFSNFFINRTKLRLR